MSASVTVTVPTIPVVPVLIVVAVVMAGMPLFDPDDVAQQDPPGADIVMPASVVMAVTAEGMPPSVIPVASTVGVMGVMIHDPVALSPVMDVDPAARDH